MVRLEADADEVAVGEEVEVRILSRVEAASCLALTYADKGSLAARTVPLFPAADGYRGSFTVFVEPRHVPRIRTYAVVVKDGESYYTQWATTTVKVKSQTAVMEVEAAAAADTYRPGEEAAVRVECLTADGAPLPADMSLAVVDEALLALAADETKNVPVFFEWALARPAECEIANSLRARGELAKVVYRFPYYEWPYGAAGGDFVPVDVARWGPAARVVERVFLKDIHGASLETYFDLSMQEELAGKEEAWLDGNRDVARRLRLGKFL
ncbi:MAG: hypothetical protein GTN49_10705, partial [candidate division Zixibacteria bacterium]|nr:hypothetical protein [candidate division Zixibacteria bacterium]